MTRSRLTACLAVLLLGLCAFPASAAEPGGEERYVYQWELKKLAALVGGILIPGQGTGLLTYEPQADGRLQSELLITSDQSKAGEFWRYGAVIDRKAGRTLRAWSSYLWRGEEKSENERIDQAGVIDVASGIYQIRKNPPTKPRRMKIWSDGKIYPVLVVPKGEDVRTLPDGRKVPTRHYQIRGLDIEGERFWKGHMDLWLAKDEIATPVEIHFDRSLVGVRLKLDQPL